MGSGKSTAVKAIASQFNSYSLVKFAQPLYDIQEMVYARVEDVYKRPADFVKDRKLLQWLGTDWGRSLDQELWVKLWKSQVNSLLSDVDVIVCDDLRFDNEAEAIKSYTNSVIIKLVRDNNVSHAQGGEGIKAHASEAGIDNKFVDYKIDNNGSLGQYEEKLLNVINQLKGRK